MRRYALYIIYYAEVKDQIENTTVLYSPSINRSGTGIIVESNPW